MRELSEVAAVLRLVVVQVPARATCLQRDKDVALLAIILSATVMAPVGIV